MPSNSWKTDVQQFYLFERTTYHIKYIASFLNCTFLSFAYSQILALNHLFLFYELFQRIKALLQICEFFSRIVHWYTCILYFMSMHSCLPLFSLLFSLAHLIFLTEYVKHIKCIELNCYYNIIYAISGVCL